MGNRFGTGRSSVPSTEVSSFYSVFTSICHYKSPPPPPTHPHTQQASSSAAEQTETDRMPPPTVPPNSAHCRAKSHTHITPTTPASLGPCQILFTIWSSGPLRLSGHLCPCRETATFRQETSLLQYHSGRLQGEDIQSERRLQVCVSVSL